jgi:hypothetical protein
MRFILFESVENFDSFEISLWNLRTFRISEELKLFFFLNCRRFADVRVVDFFPESFRNMIVFPDVLKFQDVL